MYNTEKISLNRAIDKASFICLLACFMFLNYKT